MPTSKKENEENTDNQKAELVSKKIDDLTGQIIKQAEELRNQVQDSEIQKSLKELRDATTLFQSMKYDATSSVIQNTVNNTPSSKTVGAYDNGCGDAHKPKCCMQLYISALRIIDGQPGDGRMELIVAVQAGDTWGLAPGLNSFVSVPPGSRGLKLNDPIANFCIPCDGCKTIPLHAEALELPRGGWLDSFFEGRLESGSAQSAITLRCDCDIAPVKMAIGMTAKENIKGVVEVEVSAKRIEGGCC